MPMVLRGADMLKSLAPPSEPDPKADPNADPNATPQNDSQSGQTLLDKAINTVTQTPDKSAAPGYGKKERTEMDRLFETSQ